MHHTTRLRPLRRGAVPALVLLGVLLALAPVAVLLSGGAAAVDPASQPTEVHQAVQDLGRDVLTVVRDVPPGATTVSAVLALLTWCGALVAATPLGRTRRGAPLALAHAPRARRRAPPLH